MKSFTRPNTGRMLQRGYQAGVLWRVFEQNSLIPSYLLLDATAFYDQGLACPYSSALLCAILGILLFGYGMDHVLMPNRASSHFVP